ncbi:MAG TPA: PmoA family protein [Roseimicrobium sp.]|nr:PmoA family protein [Roseimicrobium sp.]
MKPMRASVILVSYLALALPLISSAASGVKLTKKDSSVLVSIQGKPFTEYHYANVPRPFMYPVIGPTGDGMTRNYPMTDVAGEEHDHIHHRGLWYAHFSVNGTDVWGEGPKSGRIVHKKFLDLKSGSKEGVIRTANAWVDTNNVVLCEDERTIRIQNTKDNIRIVDFNITIKATAGDIVLGDDKDGAMAIRVAESMRLKRREGKKMVAGEGHIVNSEGVRDDDTWGKRAKWCDYYGPVNGKTVGVAIFDNPSNPRFPTWWHVRDYGLFAANPFGQRHFEKLTDTHAGDMKIPAGQSVTFKYRFYFHEGDEKSAKVEETYQEYVRSTSKSARK